MRKLISLINTDSEPMCEPISDKINRYVEYTSDEIERAVSLVNIDNQAVAAKTLLCAIFDSIAKSVFPDIEHNGERFRRLLREGTSWANVEKCSLLHLVRAFELNEKNQEAFDQLRKDCIGKFEKIFPVSRNALIRRSELLCADLDYVELLHTWPMRDGKPLKIGSVAIYQFKHENLFLYYRNSLVHEFRCPGVGMESFVKEEKEPHYQRIATLTGISGSSFEYTNSWELLYPLGFFKKICEEALCYAERIHTQNGTSPFANFSDSTYWIPKFNE